MEREDCPSAWLDTAQALERLRTLTGLTIGCRGLLKLCQAELCRAYVDCSFATGEVSAEQLLVRRIRGAGHCELLDVGAPGSSVAEAPESRALIVGGSVVVCGVAWVYSTEQARPSREEGFWRVDLGGLQRPLYFRAEDIAVLAERIREGERQLQARRASA
ncbi:hypothetical protein NGA35_00440 [Pseudomonas stutzeri]|nr:hypothetical protein [Stutzerimonas stutzeri]